LLQSTRRGAVLFSLLLGIASILVSSLAFGDAKEFYHQRKEILRAQAAGGQLNFANFASPPVLPPSVVQGEFDQRINPNDATDMRTFKQRYFHESKYAQGAQPPVLYYICGEATCTPSYLNGAIASQAKRAGAHVIALEHRYYGKSIPFATLSTENLKFLTTELALKDLDSFQAFARASLGLTGRWVSVGGSYPGSLSAFYRLKYPSNVVGALASSAPVLSKANFEEYDLHVNAVAGDACAAAIRKAVKDIEEKLKTPAGALAIKKVFAAEAVADDVDFLYLVADVAAAAVQYGMQSDFCSAIEGANAIQGYGAFARNLYQQWGVNAFQFSVASAFSLDPDDYIAGFGLRSWLYQSCTEYGYFQNAYHDPAKSTRSSRINEAYHAKLCERLFGLKDPVPASETNARYYERLLDPKQATAIYFTNGTNDPWTKLSITADNGNDVNDELTYFSIEGAAHCEDLGLPGFGDSVALKKSRDRFEELLATWLK
jgi:pimeloyl-ACP methyl ester carboxylesterase